MMLTPSELLQSVLGSVLGGAVGDALGAPFEGLWSRSIPEPNELLRGFAEFEGYPSGQWTDDTQLTVATLKSITRCGEVDPFDIAQTIAKLWTTQEVIGPGGACTESANRLLAGGDWRTSGAPVGQAGNGAAMRTAALGLFFLDTPEDLVASVSDVSRITHQDPRSIAGGVAIACATRLVTLSKSIEGETLCNTVAESVQEIDATFASFIRQLPERLSDDPLKLKEYLAWSRMRSPEFAEPIITPFVIPTVLASLWAVIQFPNSWSDAVANIIGLGGDVDTLGAIVGAIMGAKLGFNSIPPKLLAKVHKGRDLTELAQRYFKTITAKR